MADICELDNETYTDFLVLYWCALAFVIMVALLTLLTKFIITADKGMAESEPDARPEPLTDVERWFMQSQKMRQVEAERHEEKRVQMELARG